MAGVVIETCNCKEEITKQEENNMENRISVLEDKLNAMMEMQKKIAIKNGDIPFKIVEKRDIYAKLGRETGYFPISMISSDQFVRNILVGNNVIIVKDNTLSFFTEETMKRMKKMKLTEPIYEEFPIDTKGFVFYRKVRKSKYNPLGFVLRIEKMTYSRRVPGIDLDTGFVVDADDCTIAKRNLGIGITLSEEFLNLFVDSSCHCSSEKFNASINRYGRYEIEAENYFTGRKSVFKMGTGCLLCDSKYEYRQLRFDSIIPYKNRWNAKSYFYEHGELYVYDMDDNYICKFSELSTLY